MIEKLSTRKNENILLDMGIITPIILKSILLEEISASDINVEYGMKALILGDLCAQRIQPVILVNFWSYCRHELWVMTLAVYCNDKLFLSY